MAADALQTLVLPLFAEGALSPADDLLDLGVQPNWCVCWVGTGSSYPAFAAGGVNLPTVAESTGLEKLSIADHRCMSAGQFTTTLMGGAFVWDALVATRNRFPLEDDTRRSQRSALPVESTLEKIPRCESGDSVDPRYCAGATAAVRSWPCLVTQRSSAGGEIGYSR